MRYSALFALPQPLCFAGVPVSVETGTLFRDHDAHCLVAQLKLKNRSCKPVSSVLIGLTLTDPSGTRLLSVNYQYTGLPVPPDGELGQYDAIALADCNSAAFSAAVLRVCFADGSVWDAFAQPAPVSSVSAPPRSSAPSGKKYWLPLLLAGVALLLALAYHFLYFRQALAGNTSHLSLYLRQVMNAPRILSWLLAFLLPIVCLLLTGRRGAGCKPLGIVCLAVSGIQVAASILYLVLLLGGSPAYVMSYISWIPGVQLLLPFHRIYATHRMFLMDLPLLLSCVCFILKNLLAGICLLKTSK